MRKFVFCSALLIGSIAGTATGQESPPAAPADSTADPFLWLEELNGPRALDWVKAENAKTLSVLQADPHFASLYSEALAIGQAEDRIPYPTLINGRIYNFWRDSVHVRGIWRTTSLADYAQTSPSWTTVLDLDALATAEGQNWIWKGANCDSPSRQRCLIWLSDGGEDAATMREFDLVSGQFVADGFMLPRGKQGAAWASEDTLLVSREWMPGDLTASGYPFIVKSLARGMPLSSAIEVYRGTATDVSAYPFAMSDGQGHRALGVRRGLSFFESEWRLSTPSGLRQIDMPHKALDHHQGRSGGPAARPQIRGEARRHGASVPVLRSTAGRPWRQRRRRGNGAHERARAHLLHAKAHGMTVVLCQLTPEQSLAQHTSGP